MSHADALARWPQGRPLGLLVLASGAPSWNEIEEQLATERPRAWWSARSENMVTGPSPDPPFEHMLWMQLDDPAEANAWLDRLDAAVPAPGLHVVLTDAPDARRLRMLRASQLLLRQLPAPQPAGEFPEEMAGGVLPDRAQVERMQALPQDSPVLALNLNVHPEKGRDPETGEIRPGMELFQEYFRAGFRTFSRLGARILWFGACRGVLRGDEDVHGWQAAAGILYPSRASFLQMGRVPKFAAKAAYRVAGLERSWVVMCRVTAASAPGDVAPD